MKALIKIRCDQKMQFYDGGRIFSPLPNIDIVMNRIEACMLNKCHLVLYINMRCVEKINDLSFFLSILVSLAVSS